MFILRRITSESNQSNVCLGQSYHLVGREENPEQFYRTYHSFLGYDPDKVTEDFKESVNNTVYAFIIYREGAEIEPLYKDSHYYIMMSDGTTFANISFK